jgi:hypothetical protein
VTLQELYALIHAEFGGAYPLDLDVQGARWVMDLASYREVRAVCRAAGAIYPEGDDPENWVPDPKDRLMGLCVEVREDGGVPHIERPERRR